MRFVKEFKEFAVKGSVIDLAVGVIIGSTFGKLVTSLVEDIITPAILNPALKAINAENLSQLVVPGTAIKYGNFLSAAISFAVITFALFMMIKGINKLKKEKTTETETSTKPSSTDALLIEIRDELRK